MLGSIRDFSSTNGSVEGTAFFASSPGGQLAETMCREGHLRDLSAGYQRLDSEWIPEKQSMTVGTRTFTGPKLITKRWRLKEGSLLPIGADGTTKTRGISLSPQITAELVKRGLAADATEEQALEFLQRQLQITDPNNHTERGEHHMPPEAPPAPTTEEIRIKERGAERIRQSEINAIASKFGDRFTPDDQFKDMESLRGEAVEKGWSKEQFSEAVLNRMGEAKRVNIATDEGDTSDLGISEKELKKYSLARSIYDVGTGRGLDNIVREASDAYAKKIQRQPDGFFIAPDVLRGMNLGFPPELREMLRKYNISTRALSGASASTGGYTISTEVLGSSLIELLRNKTRLVQMGARQLTGLVGNIAIPRQAGGATAYWVNTNGPITPSQQAFAQLGLVPHRLGADTAYDKEFLIQSTLDVEAFTREDLMKVLAIEKDRAGINGNGANGEPLGILNMTGLNTVTFSGAPSWAKVVSFNTKLGQSNVADDSRAWLTTPGVEGSWMTTPKVANYPTFILGDDGKVVRRPFFETNQVPSDKVIYANWSDLILADWAGIDIVVDPYSLKRSGQIEVTIQLWTDLGARHTPSFCVSTDAGNQ